MKLSSTEVYDEHVVRIIFTAEIEEEAGQKMPTISSANLFMLASRTLSTTHTHISYVQKGTIRNSSSCSYTVDALICYQKKRETEGEREKTNPNPPEPDGAASGQKLLLLGISTGGKVETDHQHAARPSQNHQPTSTGPKPDP